MNAILATAPLSRQGFSAACPAFRLKHWPQPRERLLRALAVATEPACTVREIDRSSTLAMLLQGAPTIATQTRSLARQSPSNRSKETSMNRFASIAFVAASLFAAPLIASAADETPDATIRLSGKSVAVGVGYSHATGTLSTVASRIGSTSAASVCSRPVPLRLR